MKVIEWFSPVADCLDVEMLLGSDGRPSRAGATPAPGSK
jgi:hypothetical protein